MSETSLDFLRKSKDFVELNIEAGWRVDLRYASTRNFVGVNMYGNFNRAFLHRIAAEKLNTALAHLKSTHPSHNFLIYDALRPRSVQRILWRHVVGTEDQKYIANPDLGSLHNFGFAVDLTIVDAVGNELDMGAGYDDFRPIAQPQLESEFVAKGLLTSQHMAHRKLLREAMHAGGFTQLPHEWWHFDALPKEQVRAQFTIVE